MHIITYPMELVISGASAHNYLSNGTCDVRWHIITYPMELVMSGASAHNYLSNGTCDVRC